MNTENDNSFENAENEKNNHRNDGIATVSILDGVQKPERHLNGDGNGSGTLTPGGNPMAPPSIVSEPPASSSEIEFEEPDPEDASSPKDPVADMDPVISVQPPVTPQQTNNPQPPAMAAVSPMQVAPPPQPSPVKSAETGNAPSEATSGGGEGAALGGHEQANTDTASIESGSTNEKRTYANLFKSSSAAAAAAGVYPTPGGASAGGKMVPAGPLSLPGPAFGGKTSQPTSPPVTKEGSPAAGFQGAGSSNKPFRGQKGTGGGNRGAAGGSGHNANLTASGGSAAASNMGGGPPASRDRYQASRESVSSAAGEDSISGHPGSGPPGGPDSIRGGRGPGGGGRMNSLSSYPDSHQVFVGNLPHQCQESHLEDLFSQFGKVRN